MNSLEERLNQLETRVTRYRNFNILLCLLLVAVVTVAQADLTDVIRAKKLEIVNDLGETVVELTSVANDGAMFIKEKKGGNRIYAGSSTNGKYGFIKLHNETGRPMLSFVAGETNGYLSVQNDKGKQVVQLTGDENGDGSIWINSSEGKSRFHAGSSTSGSLINLYDKDGEPAALIGTVGTTSHLQVDEISTIKSKMILTDELWVTKKLEVVNEEEKAVVELTSDDYGNGLIFVNSKDGKNLAGFGSNKLGNGLLNLNNKLGKQLVTIFASDAGNLVLSDTDDNPIVNLGSNSDGNGRLELANNSGKRLVSLLAGYRSGHLTMFHTNGRNIANLGSNNDGDGQLFLYNKTGSKFNILWPDQNSP